MYVFANSTRSIIIASICSMAIIAFTYFVIVGPQLDKANDQVDKTLQQFQPSTNGGTAAPGDQLDKAQKLQACIQAAGQDVDKLQACTTKFD
jgi:hypothetical protein